jgi:hypothetical protein
MLKFYRYLKNSDFVGRFISMGFSFASANAAFDFTSGQPLMFKEYFVSALIFSFIFSTGFAFYEIYAARRSADREGGHDSNPETDRTS